MREGRVFQRIYRNALRPAHASVVFRYDTSIEIPERDPTFSLCASPEKI